jgi:glycosyltransferase involved in cell wall biosynthesis
MLNQNLPEILVISSYPPRECGIANYSIDLIRALNNKFNNSFNLKVCALESESEKYTYDDTVEYILDTSDETSYEHLANSVNQNEFITLVLLQHEFGFFKGQERSLLRMIQRLTVPTIMTFHTVLPQPNADLKTAICQLVSACKAVTVMTQGAAQVLQKDYGIASQKINVIAHGTHLVQYMDKQLLKQKFGFHGRNVLSTFGLISSGKSIETTLDAMPAIIHKNPNVLFLVIGKTHPTVVKHEGEAYRLMLESKVSTLNLSQHVLFINQYLPLGDLLSYLQLTDIYLFTSNDPYQAVSGTFSYAIGSGCPVISTPIPHAIEVLGNDAGILIDFANSSQLGVEVTRLLEDEQLRETFAAKGLQKIASTAWENIAVAHAMLFESCSEIGIRLHYSLPDLNTNHVQKLTTPFGMIQFSNYNHPDINSGYTIDDNARAMIAMCMHYQTTRNPEDLDVISVYLNFIQFCLKPNGRFLNYVDEDEQFTEQNKDPNLDDANGRAIWALGYLISLKDILPIALVSMASNIIAKALIHIEDVHSTRSMAFALKGLYYYQQQVPLLDNIALAEKLASRLKHMYLHESEPEWNWYESYLTYGNSILPEGMLCAYLITGNKSYKEIAKASFDFLLKQTFTPTTIKLISNRSWLQKGQTPAKYGEQPIDVAYTILALGLFFDVFKDEQYLEKMEIAFNWFLGNNHLHQILYNPCTGGCYDGLEETHVNLNQGAESTVSYMMARLAMEKYIHLNHLEYSEIAQQQAGV